MGGLFRYDAVIKRAIARFNFATLTLTNMFDFGYLIKHPISVGVYVYGRCCFCNDEVGKTACFKRDFSVGYGRNKGFYRVVGLNVEYKVVIRLKVGYRNRNLYLTVRLYLRAVFHNVDIENIYAAVFVVVLVGDCRKNFCCFFCGRRDLVAYQGRAFFKATAV